MVRSKFASSAATLLNSLLDFWRDVDHDRNGGHCGVISKRQVSEVGEAKDFEIPTW